MSRRPEGLLFIGRLAKHIRQTDLEEIFERYGPIDRCEVKYGAEMAYAFVDFEDRRDAEDAMRRENGRRLMGSAIIVEWARGNPRRPMMNNPSNSRRPQSHDECYKCHRTGHWARDCEERSYGGRGGGGGGGGGGAYESRSRRRSRSDSRDRSHSRDHRSRRRSRSRSPSYDGKRRRRSYSRSVSPARNGSRDVSKSRSRSVSRD